MSWTEDSCGGVGDRRCRRGYAGRSSSFSVGIFKLLTELVFVLPSFLSVGLDSGTGC